jgi:hypothetical protein
MLLPPGCPTGAGFCSTPEGRGAVATRAAGRWCPTFECVAAIYTPSCFHTPSMTGTDADAVRMSRAGVPVGLVSVPNRYMHSPNQIVSVTDVDHTAELIAAWLCGLDENSDFHD